jgi:hypothetical protein
MKRVSIAILLGTIGVSGTELSAQSLTPVPITMVSPECPIHHALVPTPMMTGLLFSRVDTYAGSALAFTRRARCIL